MTRRILIALLAAEMLAVVGMVISSYWLDWKYAQQEVINPPATQKSQQQAQPPSRLKLLFGGDVMLGRQVETNVRRYGNTWPFDKISSTTRKADLFVVNLESPLRTDAGSTPDGSLILRGYPVALQGMVAAGVDFVSLANNHIPDMRLAGLQETQSLLEGKGIKYAGAGETAGAAGKGTVVELKGLKVGFVSCTYGVNFDSTGVYYNTCSASDVTSQVKATKKSADLVVLLAHFGAEYAATANTLQKSVAHAAVEAGADLVIGHHPHVPQPYEKYQGKYIFYSLGNLVFDQQPGEWRDRSALVEITVEDKKVKSFKLLPYKIFGYGQPQFLSGTEAEAVIERFTP